MSSSLRGILPAAAVLGALMLLFSLASGVTDRAALLIDNGQTRLAVENTVSRLQAVPATSLDDPTLRAAVEQMKDAPYVASVWLFAPDGSMVYSSNSRRTGSSAEQGATPEMQRILSALPEGEVNDQLRTTLLVASAIQAEGEHNDVFRHMVRQLTSFDGKTLGLLGVAYDVSEGISSPSLSYVAALLVVLLGLALYWFALPLWVFLDARERGDRAWAWAALVFVGNLVGLLAYILARRPPARASAPAA
jgi:hypothetical protein